MKRALIAGNGEMRWNPQTEGYDEIVVFNAVRPRWLLPLATAHWCVREPDGKSPLYSGQSLLRLHKASPVFVDSYKPAANEMLEEWKSRAPAVISPWDVLDRDSYRWVPSTGFIAILHYVNLGYMVDACGFQWRGWEGHNWEYERQTCLYLQSVGNLRILQQ